MNRLGTILLAEDDSNDAELTLTALQEHGVANPVDRVRDGAEALDYLYRRGEYQGLNNPPPVVVLLDIKMPKVDGIEVLRQIKADPKLRVLPVVMLTSSREERDLMESYRIGVNGYVVKPVEFHDFIDVVTKLGVFWAAVNEAPASNSLGAV